MGDRGKAVELLVYGCGKGPDGGGVNLLNIFDLTA